MATRMRLPDLVRDSKLETEFRDGFTIHTHHISNPAARNRAPPQKIYWYRDNYIGQGGFGSVWLERCARRPQNGLPEVRAVKQIRTNQKDSRSLDILRELEAIAKFSHERYEQCFVKSFGWYENSDFLYIAMEYIELGDLHQVLDGEPALSEPDTQAITFQILEGVSFMHDNDFAHRDLKPHNILVKSKTPDPWWVKITDFGISKRIEDNLGMASTVKGTLEFMAPELLHLARGQGVSSPFDSYATDIWAVGGIAFLALTKEPPFRDVLTLVDYSRKVTEFPLPQLESKGISLLGQQFIGSMMMRKPEERPEAAQALSHEWIKQSVSDFTDTMLPDGASGLVSEQNPTNGSNTSTSLIEEKPWTTNIIETQTEIHRERSPGIVQPQPHQEVVQPKTLQEIFQPEPYQKIHQELAHPVLFTQSPSQHLNNSSLSKYREPRESKPVVGTHHEGILPTTTEVVNESLSTEESRPSSLTGHRGFALAVDFSPDGNNIATGYSGGDIFIWSATTGQKLRILQGRRGSVYSLAFSLNGTYLVAAFQNGTIALWDVSKNWQREVLNPGVNFSCATISPDELYIAAGTAGSEIVVINLSTREHLYMNLHSQTVRAVAFSPDGKFIVSGSDDGAIKIWEAEYGTLNRNFRGHQGAVKSIAFSPNGKLMASASADSTVKLWNLSTGREFTLTGHTLPVHSVAFSPDGTLLASGGEDEAIRLWNVGAADLHCVYRSISGPVNDVAFSPDGKFIAAACDERTVEQFRVSAVATQTAHQIHSQHSGKDLEQPIEEEASPIKYRTKETGEAEEITLPVLGAIYFELKYISYASLEAWIRTIDWLGVTWHTAIPAVSNGIDQLRINVSVQQIWLTINEFEELLYRLYRERFGFKLKLVSRWGLGNDEV